MQENPAVICREHELAKTGVHTSELHELRHRKAGMNTRALRQRGVLNLFKNV